MSDLSVRDVARLLGVPERTVYRWANDGELPHDRLREEIRFNRVELQEWAQAHGLPLSPELYAEDGRAAVSLAAALTRGGIARDVPGRTREEVLAAVSALPGIPASIDRDELLALLLSRERLATTGLGDGIALPHPRDPLVLGSHDPVVVLAFLSQPVDYQALDGKPVGVLFGILSPTVKAHLALLSRLAFALHDPDLRALLAARAPDDALLARVRAIEAGIPQTGAPAETHP